MHRVPKVNLPDPTVEPTDEELHALMTAVREVGKRPSGRMILNPEALTHAPVR